MNLSKRVLQLKPSPTLGITSKVKAMRKRGIDVVGFGAGEPDFDTPLNIKRAAITAINRGFTKYTPSSGIPELKSAVAEKLRKENHLKYKPEEVVISCGAKHALYNIFQVLCNRGEEVVVVSPYWVSYPELVALSGARARIVKAREQDGFVVRPEEIKKCINRRTKAIVINSPSNPTGAVFRKTLLRKIAELAVAKRIFVISDEIYEKLIYDGEEHISIGSLSREIAKLTVTVNGVSKAHAMTGWRIGYVAGPLEVIKAISALQSHSTSNPTSISQMAALEALKGDQNEVVRMREEFALRRDYMVRRINSLDRLSCVKPKGAFYIFLNIAKVGLDSKTFAERLLEEAHVACVPGCAFGSDEHVRLSFATGMDSIKEGLDRVQNWLERLPHNA